MPSSYSLLKPFHSRHSRNGSFPPIPRSFPETTLRLTLFAPTTSSHNFQPERWRSQRSRRDATRLDSTRPRIHGDTHTHAEQNINHFTMAASPAAARAQQLQQLRAEMHRLRLSVEACVRDGNISSPSISTELNVLINRRAAEIAEVQRAQKKSDDLELAFSVDILEQLNCLGKIDGQISEIRRGRDLLAGADRVATTMRTDLERMAFTSRSGLAGVRYNEEVHRLVSELVAICDANVSAADAETGSRPRRLEPNKSSRMDFFRGRGELTKLLTAMHDLVRQASEKDYQLLHAQVNCVRCVQALKRVTAELRMELDVEQFCAFALVAAEHENVAVGMWRMMLPPSVVLILLRAATYKDGHCECEICRTNGELFVNTSCGSDICRESFACLPAIVRAHASPIHMHPLLRFVCFRSQVCVLHLFYRGVHQERRVSQTLRQLRLGRRGSRDDCRRHWVRRRRVSLFLGEGGRKGVGGGGQAIRLRRGGGVNGYGFYT